MPAQSRWVPARRDMIWINCNPQAGRELSDVLPLLVLSPREFNGRTGIVIGLPMTTACYNATNPFAIRFAGPREVLSYILAHQPKSFDWRARAAKPHPWRQVPEQAFSLACETRNQIIELGG
jgi:mRNA interferase MazF